MTPESKVKSKIRKYLRDNGWYYRAIGSNQYTRGGLPDTFAIKDGVVLFIECKSATGKLSGSQIETMFEIKNRGGNYIVAYSKEDVIEYCRKKKIEI